MGCFDVGVAVSFLSFFGTIYVLSSKHWKENSPVSSSNIAQGVQSYEGLWVRCVSSLPGMYQCDTFDEGLFEHEASLQAQRAMMVIASIAAVAGVLCAALGMDCITAMGDHTSKAKMYTGRTGGGCVILTGCLTLAAVSWYAADVVEQFRKSEIYEDTMFVYEFGSALYVGWVSSILALAAGGILLCCNCGSAEDGADDYPYTYNPAKPQNSRPNTEYV